MTDEFPAWKPDEIEKRDVGFDAPEVEWGDMDPADLERLFDVLNAAVDDSVGLDSEELDRLLSVLERVLFAPSPLDDEEVDRLFEVLEEAIVDPANPEHVEEVLAILDASLTGGEESDVDGVLSVLEAALVDPTDAGSALEDAMRFVEGVGASITNPDARAAESTTDDVLSLLDLTGFGTTDGDFEDTAEEMDSWLDDLGLGMSFTGNVQPEDDDVTTFLDAVDTEFRHDGEEGPAMADEFRIARILAAGVQRATEYSVRSGVRVGTRIARAAMTARSAADLVEESQAIAFDELERLGFDSPDRGEAAGGSDDLSGYRDGDARRDVSREDLRAQGERLLDQSADVEHREDDVHPAFPRILDSISPDEGRILRLLATEGPQPSVDVRDVGYLPVSSKLVAAGLTMIGEESGCRYPSRVPAYLNNLQRLGLIWFSDEPVEELKRYQVLEAQPSVDAALDEARRAKMIRRSVHLTPFGFDFCRACLPIDVVADDATGVYDVPDESTSDAEGVEAVEEGAQGADVPTDVGNTTEGDRD
ncbi:MAG: DUF4393 domain-containing protein [Halorientalis sp.]